MKEMTEVKLRTLLILTLSVLTTPLIEAAPVVIHDAGGESLVPYIQQLFEEEPSDSVNLSQDHPSQTQGDYGQSAMPFSLPISTPEMSPGRITPRAINQPYMTRPLFLIGTDRMSRQWLIQNRERLSELHAAGMIVQADSMEELQSIARLIEGLNIQIMPASASDIARQLGLKHYPVLIWKHGIEQ